MARRKYEEEGKKMENKDYNGWANYETWNWYLWYGDNMEKEVSG